MGSYLNIGTSSIISKYLYDWIVIEQCYPDIGTFQYRSSITTYWFLSQSAQV